MSKPMQMNCSEVLAGLPLHVGGDLESPLAERVEQHLTACGSCREVLAQADFTRKARLDHFEQMAAGAPETSLWPDLRERLRGEGLIGGGLSEKQDDPGVTTSQRSQAGRLLRFIPMAAAAAGVFFLGVLAQKAISVTETIDSVPVVPVVTDSSSVATDLHQGSKVLQPVRESAGSPLKPVHSVEDYLEQRAAPFYGEVAPSFNAFHPRQGFNSAVGLRGSAPAARRDGVR